MERRPLEPRTERGMSLVELLIALLVLSLGILGIARVFPAGSRTQEQDRLLTRANWYAQEQLETLTGRTWSDALLTDGRHPSATSNETLEGGMQRWYTVTPMTGKLDNLKQVVVTVSWSGAGEKTRSVTATSFVRR
jgi:prepilin-type N-terminal cleavage/methylation domain-containing protein